MSKVSASKVAVVEFLAVLAQYHATGSRDLRNEATRRMAHLRNPYRDRARRLIHFVATQVWVREKKAELATMPRHQLCAAFELGCTPKHLFPAEFLTWRLRNAVTLSA